MQRVEVITLLVILNGLGMAHCGAQNLVPNGSFEQYTTCPDPNFFGQWQLVEGWTSPYAPSVDYYNRCAGGVVCSVPFNTCGYQEPADGDAYIGIVTYLDGGAPWYRETFGCQLTEPLQPGIPVYVSYKVSAGGWGSWDGNSARFAAKGPGMNFFTAYPADWSAYLYPNSAFVDMPGVLNDTANWTTVSGSFVPDSAYMYIVIANFFEDSMSLIEILDSMYAASLHAYAFVDQVCVSYDPAYCSNWNGQLDRMKETISVWARQNPFSSVLELNASNELSRSFRVEAFDPIGRHIEQFIWPAGTNKLAVNAEGYPNGIITLVFSGAGSLPAPIRLVHVSP